MDTLSLTMAFLLTLGTFSAPATSYIQPHDPTVQIAAASAPHYGLPLKVFAYAECDKSSSVLYEVTPTGQLRSQNPAKPTTYKTRALARLEIQQLSETLKKLDLYTQNLKLKRIPAGSPQTQECRQIEKIELDVNGVKKTIDGKSSRSLEASKDYLARIEQLKTKLRELSAR